MRGKAVSVSRLGDELRVWDLEGGIASRRNQQRSRSGDLSVRVQPAKSSGDIRATEGNSSPPRTSIRFALDQGFDDAAINRGWVGFDEQNVVVLREKIEGDQALVIYNFA